MKTTNKIKNQKVLANLGLGIVTLIVGLSFIFVKIGLREADAYDLLAHRFTIAFFMILILGMFGRIKFPKIHSKDWISILSVSLFYPILFFGFQTIGMESSTASQAGIIFALSPTFTIIAGALFLKEKTTLMQKFGVAMSFLGLLYIFLYRGGVQNQSWLGNLFLILSVLCTVGYYMIGKRLVQFYDSSSLTAIMVSIAFIAFNTLAITRHLINDDLNTFFESFQKPSFLLSALYLGTLSSVVTSFLTNYALTFVPTSSVSIYNNLNPIIAIIGGVVFLSEHLYTHQLIGGFGVIAGVGMVLLFKKEVMFVQLALNRKNSCKAFSNYTTSK
ncbi:DMT family transporter [Maribellus sp. CM-23]|uniref:DMT family transporter n=1 Tax=Maribellus sp. CM-23 TaxID=2781026 RepID=UPI001F38A4CD|nr:DMT family transporter [Maribellus sp. CM-23]MCE4564582.1 DMT family transporter [Maribellus sp. CM-23]